MKVGGRVSDIGHAIQAHVEAHGFSVVREFVGHGIGASLHEEPQIANYGEPGRGPRLAEGMTLAIEPMVNMGRPAVKVLADGWTAVTKDGSLSAHFEHTVAVTKDGPLVLTMRPVVWSRTAKGPDEGIEGTRTQGRGSVTGSQGELRSASFSAEMFEKRRRASRNAGRSKGLSGKRCPTGSIGWRSTGRGRLRRTRRAGRGRISSAC